MKMMTKSEAMDFAERWIEGWNRHDLDAVLIHYTDDVEFSSPFVTAFTNDTTGRLKGKESVRAYWAIGLSRLPDLHFTLIDVLAGVDSLTVLYRGHRGLAAEIFEFNANGKVCRGQAMYCLE